MTSRLVAIRSGLMRVP